jgi:hypothetical protein
MKSKVNRTTAVVVSDRINLTPLEVAQGLLVHELGHVIDFACFGSRYVPKSQPGGHNPDAPGVAMNGIYDYRYRRSDLPITGTRTDAAEVMAAESDVEVRADLLAGMILRNPRVSGTFLEQFPV